MQVPLTLIHYHKILSVSAEKQGHFFTQMTKIELLQQRLTLYLKAERDILSGQTVEIEGMRITRADLDTVRRQINNLRQQLTILSRLKPRPRIRQVIPK